jgi:hypothetical protein
MSYVREKFDALIAERGAPSSGSDWAMQMAKLRDFRPRPIAKLYGKRGPTPEQLTAWKEENREWSALYRHAQKMQKKVGEAESALYRARQAEGRPSLPPGSMKG